MRGVKGSTPGHGTSARYSKGCRCASCTRATRLYTTYRIAAGAVRITSSTGTIRRILALHAIGWSADDIAARLGCSVQWVRQLRSRTTHPVLATTARRVARLYDELSGMPGPSERSRFLALRAGWAPPLAWDDIDDLDATPDLGTATAGFDLDEWARIVRWGEQPDRA